MGRLMNNILSLVVVAVVLTEAAAATKYTVGDSLGWTIPPNTSFYSDWTSSKTFHIGDSLIFNWTGTHNVAEVKKAEYDGCIKPAGITFGSPGILNLTTNGTFYYICTVGTHCSLGQKVAITVGASANTTTTTVGSPPPPSSSASITSPLSLIGNLFSAIVTSIVFSLFA